MKHKYRNTLFGVIVALISMKCALCALNFPDFDTSFFINIDGDGGLNAMYFNSIKADGIIGALRVRNLGAPGISSIIDTPLIDWNYAFLIWLTTRFFSATGAFYFLWILLYGLAGMTMFFLLTKLCHSDVLNIVLSLSYAIAPYHFMRDQYMHFTLSAYYMLPLAVFLIITMYKLEYDCLFPIDYNLKQKIIYLLCIVVLGFSCGYYVFFSLIMMMITIVYKAIERKKICILVREGKTLFLVALLMLIGLLPKAIFGILNGKNSTDAVRTPYDTERFGLKIIQLFMPPNYSNFSLYKRISSIYIDANELINENVCSSLGLVASIGFILLCVYFIYLTAFEKKLSHNEKMLKVLGINVIALLLYCTIGGFGTILSYYINSQFRCLNRISIVISTVSLISIALIYECSKRKYIKKLITMLCCIGFIIAMMTEIDYKSDECIQQYAERNSILEDFFGELMSVEEEGAMIYQLPYMKFPESPFVGNLAGYSQMVGYAYAPNLRWSFGGVSSRDTQAYELYCDEGMSDEFIEQLIEAGFQGVYINRNGYMDGGDEIINFYNRKVNSEPIISRDGCMYYYKLQE